MKSTKPRHKHPLDARLATCRYVLYSVVRATHMINTCMFPLYTCMCVRDTSKSYYFLPFIAFFLCFMAFTTTFIAVVLTSIAFLRFSGLHSGPRLPLKAGLRHCAQPSSRPRTCMQVKRSAEAKARQTTHTQMLTCAIGSMHT